MLTASTLVRLALISGLVQKGSDSLMRNERSIDNKVCSHKPLTCLLFCIMFD